MVKFLFEVVVFIVLNSVRPALWAEDFSTSLKQFLNSHAIGVVGDGVIRHKSFSQSEIKAEYVIRGSDYSELCRGAVCEADWSVGRDTSWVVVRNILSNQVLVVNQSGEVQWRGGIGFELRSMLSVSADGNTIAAIGRENGVDSIRHITKSGARVVWTLPDVVRSERLQVGWQPSKFGNVVSDGKWIMFCDDSAGQVCRREFLGFLPSLSPDGNMIAFFSSETTLEVYDVKSRTVVTRLEARSGWAFEMPKWSPNSKFLILNEIARDGSRLSVFEFSTKRRAFVGETRGKTMAHVGIVSRVAPVRKR
jgi:hypothetical protein